MLDSSIATCCASSSLSVAATTFVLLFVAFGA